jgi:hypothetical protein
MRLTAPAFAGAAVALAAAFAWYFRPHADPPFAPSTEAALTQPTPVASSARAPVSDTATLSSGAAPRGQALAVEARPAPTLERAPLPGETPSTPMTNLMTERQRDVPPQLVEGEREFAAGPVDAAWAIGLVPRWMNVVGDASGSMKSVAYFWRDGYAPPPREGQVP